MPRLKSLCECKSKIYNKKRKLCLRCCSWVYYHMRRQLNDPTHLSTYNQTIVARAKRADRLEHFIAEGLKEGAKKAKRLR